MTLTRRETLSILLGIAGLALTIALFASGQIDMQVQQPLFDAETGKWLIRRGARFWLILLYKGPKVVLVICGIGLVLTLIAGYFVERFRPYRLTVLYLAACLAVVPLAANGVKAVTNIACPSHLTVFGGKVPHVGLFEPYPPSAAKRHYRCWPASHPSGGFALLSLGFLGIWRRVWHGFVPSMVVGSLMGFYQLAKGAHFLSHVLITFFGALVICALLSLLVRSLAPKLGVPRVNAIGEDLRRRRKPDPG